MNLQSKVRDPSSNSDGSQVHGHSLPRYFAYVIGTNKYRWQFWNYINKHFSNWEIERALSALSADQKMVCKLYFQQQKSFQEITVIVKHSLSWVRRTNNKGVDELVDQFEKYFAKDSTLHYIAECINYRKASKVPADFRKYISH